ncbi:S-phase kinase-associated protein 1 [Drosophila sechellia]|uniref:GM22995 n=1 Tax=Drosophila sechellia TaxID=7238 RepID=B4I7C4_DROSE|nr:S-phase kinase-associated protein 1 [Drosophila sechellia]EDW56222.1 GM22995 [Drosophila sechellia]
MDASNPNREPSDASIIKLESSDGVIFPTQFRVAKVSETIKTMLAVSALENGENPIVPLPNVDAFILNKILIWADHHKNDDAQATEGVEVIPGSPPVISPWDANFINVDLPILFEIIQAAKYLEIKDLVDLCCKTVANMIRGKTPEQISRIFNIQRDLPSTTSQRGEEL